MEKTDRTTLRLNSPNAAIIEIGSMSEAVQQKQGLKSAISRLIASLERGLGLALFQRTPRGTEPPSHRRALIAIHNQNRHADRKNDAKRIDPRQPSPGRREVIQM